MDFEENFIKYYLVKIENIELLIFFYLNRKIS